MKRLNGIIIIALCAVLSYASSEFEELEVSMESVFTRACAQNDLQTVQRLVHTGALTLPLPLHSMLKPLHVAARCNRVNILDFLIQHGASIYDAGESVLYWAAKGGSLDAIDYLITRGEEVNDMSNNGRIMTTSALCGAIYYGQLNAVKRLCVHGADIDRMVDGSLIRWAMGVLKDAPEHRVESLSTIVRYLLQQGALLCDGDDALVNVELGQTQSVQETEGNIVEQLRESLGRALGEVDHVTGFPRVLKQLILSFLSDHLRLPCSHT